MKETKVERKPAILGGKPVFKKMLPIIRPTLPDPDELLGQIREVFSSGLITNAKYVKKFEKEIAKYLRVKHAVAVSSCTSGLMLVLQALDLKGEVIVPSFTFVATVHSLVWNNLTPVFVDCQSQTCNIDPALVEEKITKRTCAIMAVYTFGNPPQISSLERISKKHKLKLIFDSAHALGSRYEGKMAGGFGNAEVFSLSPTKLLTSGEGGVVATNHDRLAQRIRIGRDYGNPGDYDSEFAGLSARMSEFHAILGLKNLERLENYISQRSRLVAKYRSMLGNISGIHFQSLSLNCRSNCNYMVIFVDEHRFGLTRDQLYQALEKENIQTKKYFYPAVHLQKAYKAFWTRYAGKLPVTESLSNMALALPLYSHMSEGLVKKVCRAIRSIYQHREAIKDIK